ncbi:DUF6461 domain-containing protein [Actinokineospora enzanensis]|uniref:DUF6461 domain-containing protein n=1 Tax=Actinokineospora enzanensis TaxID=155975 RepID=UPI0003748E53|nr:DUF6461 domain-containing protein [Actinokineospora enzanensis]
MNRYAWADTAFDLAWTLAVVAGRTARDVLAAYGAAEGCQAEWLTFQAAMDERNEHLDELGLLQLKEHGEHLLVVEPNGWIGNGPEVARKLSGPQGFFLSVYWSANGDHQIVQAQDGQLTARFDPTFIGRPAGANDMIPGWVEPDDFLLEHLRSASLLAIERVTGVGFEDAWLNEPLMTYRLPYSGD